MAMRTVKVYKGESFPLFTSFDMEMAALCNRHCVFCPNHDFKRPDEYMPMELIEKMIDELRELKYHGRWSPFGYNEPLRDKRLMGVLRLMRKRVPRVVMGLSTNADLLTPDILEELRDAGLNQLTINIYSARDGNPNPEKVAKGVTIATERADTIQRWLDKRPWIDQTGSLYQRMPVGDFRAQVLRKFGVQKDGTNFGGGFGLSNRSGNVEWFKEDRPKKRTFSGVCTKPFRILEMRYTGDVICCCNDYNGETAMGNIRDHTLVELWNAKRMNALRAHLQDGERVGLCAKCDYNGGVYKHMIARVQLQRRTPT